MLFFYIVIAVAIIFGLIQLFSSNKENPEDKIKEAGAAAAGGAIFSAGCLIQCVIAALPVLIGIALIRSCS